ncbi:1,2-phenylacetyl-CoA epoxidase subunit PaaC [Nesterenkonia jeotgali]|uniref:Phenylacetate-CoA oxygenase n=1 Tax=Nesterenkonia jeotgali TaxID=317018 RepID=A0A0W8IFE8_9MICC|nr:1,2-phenylacetyl-CoA epoxidase subunit PaaC [Nesterenkonia jeotgali]KUG58634.1 phenylacetate-CoA oxygenase [Nesterenkonia jeotgali]MBA8921606.1 ring-1,2-phenylacetyl-CoA epoxidase subunit PaaC [Nesterenkonia jeotgali]
MSFASHDSATRQSQGEAITAEEIAESGAKADDATARYALLLGDDSLILAQRLSAWISRAPELEEDVALANISLDLLGHARFLLTYAGTAWGKSEDDLAYFRGEEEFRSCRLVEQENGDFGKTIARQLIFSFYQHELYSRLVDSTDATLAAIAEKALKEVDYHQDHAAQWILRLGLGTEESARRVQDGLDSVWSYVEELFTDVEPMTSLGEIAVLPSTLREPTLTRLHQVIEQAGLSIPDMSGAHGADRSGRHSEQRGFILAEMQVLARQHPGATW